MIIVALLCIAQWTMAQDKEAKSEIVIEKVTKDKDGKEVKETIRLQGKEAEEYMKNHHSDIRIDLENDGEIHIDDDIEIIIDKNDDIMHIDIDGNMEGTSSTTSISVNDDDGMVKIEVHKDGEDFEWSGKAPVPKEVKAKLKLDFGVDLDDNGGHTIIHTEGGHKSSKKRQKVIVKKLKKEKKE